MKIFVGFVFGMLVMFGIMKVLDEPKQTIVTIRKGVDAVEQMSAEHCRSIRAECYLKKPQKVCDEEIKEECG
jgi:hypothetical protein